MSWFHRLWVRWFWGTSDIRACPPSAGVCPDAYSGVHQTSDKVDGMFCLLCGALLVEVPS